MLINLQHIRLLVNVIYLRRLSYAIIENSDGIAGQVIFEGNPNANLNISGVIEGQRDIDKIAIIKPESTTMNPHVDLFGYFILAGVILILLISIGYLTIKYNSVRGKDIRYSFIGPAIVLTIPLAICLFAIVYFYFHNLKTLEGAIPMGLY